MRYLCSIINRSKDASLKILIADDNKMIRELIREILGRREYIFIETSDGQMAVESFLSERPDIVLLDIKMEIMDGIEALKSSGSILLK